VHEAHGTRREDDYAWLRDTGDPEVLAYLRAERAFYDDAVTGLAELRDGLAAELTARTPASGTSPRWRRGDLLYFTRAVAGEEYDRLYSVDPEGGQERLLLDPRQLAPEGGHLGLGVVEPGPDGRLLAYSVDLTGDEVFELRFRDVATGQDLPDRVPRTFYGGAFSSDGASFFYTVPDGTNRPDRVIRHRLGTPVADDTVVVTEPDRRFELTLHGSRDGGWIVITSQSRDTSWVELVNAVRPDEPPRLVTAPRPGIEYTVEPMPGGWGGTDDDLLLIVTNDGAGEFRLMTAPLPGPGRVGDPADWRPVPRAVAAGGSERLEGVCLLRQHLVLSLRGDGEPFLRVLGRGPGTALGERTMREIHAGLPCGQVRLWRAEDPAAAQVTVVEQNLVTAPRWIEVDLATGERSVVKRTEVPGVDPTRYVTERIHATAPDGTKVPVTIARPAELEPGDASGALLYGYGAYESCSWPKFSVSTLSLLDRGVVYAVAHVRGGGELGRRWWHGGRLLAKQRTFDDFVAARDGLVEAGWAGEGGVVCRGASAGGLLVGAVFSQAPQRFVGAVAEVPFVDVVTTMSDPQAPLTVQEWDEWGDPVRDATAFAAMLAYSPYDNPPPVEVRPPLLVTGALHDPRVLVHEPAKWVARLRAAGDAVGGPTGGAAGPGQVLFRVELGEGAHGGPSGRFARLGYEAEILAWVLDRLGAGTPRSGSPSR
jgi:oligopeptidase B